MPLTKRQELYGWGHTPVTECLTWRPEKQRDLIDLMHLQGQKLARGLGRSYGDCSLQPDGTILMERLNHFIEFDSKRGLLRAQAGVTLAEVMERSIPRGWLPAILPGTRNVTLGGAFACNVHGKNQYRDGEFADHVQSIRLMLPNGERVDCSPTHNREIFWTTAGGMGMSGVIEEVTLKLRPISSSSLTSTTYRVDTLEAMIEAFMEHRDTSDYMLGWIDHMAKGNTIGRGIFETASHIGVENGGTPLPDYKLQKSGINVPLFAPSFTLNRYSMAVHNKLRFRKYSAWRKTETIGFNSFFHPLDRISNWNRLYGKRGFFQYQCMFPEGKDVVARIHTFLEALHSKNIFSFLAIIKYHRKGKGLLTFSQDGYSIALDFPNTPHVRSVLPQLNRWVADYGGRVYLAKDAVLTGELFRVMYGKAAQDWESVINQLDPQAQFTSLMSKRLEWKRRD